MNQMDCKQAQRVWSRVMASQEQAPKTRENQAQPAADAAEPPQMQNLLTEGYVLELMQQELAGAATYRCLAGRMKGCARKLLLTLAADETDHAKKLGAIYFLMTGKKACPGRPERPCITCNAETLRMQYQKELSARETYEQLASAAGSRACTMREIAHDECRHAQLIYQLLQSCL